MKSMKTITDMAHRQREIIQSKFEWQMRYWGPNGTEPDSGMVDCVTADRDDLLEVTELFEQGKYKEAYHKAINMDTLPRDYITDEIYKIISKAS